MATGPGRPKGSVNSELSIAKARLTRARTHYRNTCRKQQEVLKAQTKHIDELEALVAELERQGV